MPLDPKVAELANSLYAQGLPNTEGMSVSRVREAMTGFYSVQDGRRPLKSVVDRLVPGPAGLIPIRVYEPDGLDEAAPALVYLHGGAWVMGSVEITDAPCRDLAHHTRSKVVSVEYRLAPETRYPGGLEDCYAALSWVSEHAEELGVDPHRIGICGDSAGGNLAAVVTHLCRERGGPDLVFQALVYPVVDAGPIGISDTPLIDRGVIPRRVPEQTVFYRELYLESEAQLSDPHVVPLLAADFSGLPPAYVVTCEYDRLVAADEAYAQRLRDAGVPVTRRHFDEEVHGFFWTSERVRPNYRVVMEEIGEVFHRTLAAARP